MLPPLAAMRASTMPCSQMFILAESSIRFAGQPSYVARALRAAELLWISSSFRRSTMEERQLSFSRFASARFSNCATTSMAAIGLGGGVAMATLPGLASARCLRR